MPEAVKETTTGIALAGMDDEDGNQVRFRGSRRAIFTRHECLRMSARVNVLSTGVLTLVLVLCMGAHMCVTRSAGCRDRGWPRQVRSQRVGRCADHLCGRVRALQGVRLHSCASLMQLSGCLFSRVCKSSSVAFAGVHLLRTSSHAPNDGSRCHVVRYTGADATVEGRQFKIVFEDDCLAKW